MAKNEVCALTNMCMITDGSRVLVQNRKDPNWSGLVFPGGHVEPQESFVDSVIREVKEETGLTVTNVRLCGLKQFSEEWGRYVVLLFKTSDFSGTLRSSDEGDIFWIERSELTGSRLASGFEKMLEVFDKEELNENYLWMENGVWKDKNL